MKSLRSTSTKITLPLSIAILSLVLMIPAVGSARKVPAGAQDDLAEVRWATAKFHRVEAAIEAGYTLGYVRPTQVDPIITGCIAHPTAGAMGFHYFNKALIDDWTVNPQNPVDPLKPEGLVYAPGPDGKLQLVAVEYVVPSSGSVGGGVDEAPTVLGMQMQILVPPPGPAWYILHAWIWRDNPSGMFMDWNPKVVCPTTAGALAGPEVPSASPFPFKFAR